MKVAILNFDGVVPTSVAGPRDVLVQSMLIAKQFAIPMKINFEVDVVDCSASQKTKPFHVASSVSLSTRKKYDLIIIPAMEFNMVEPTLKNGAPIIKWIRKQYENGSEVAAICLGSFLLGATGLLSGKRATTHWMGAASFRKLFPDVILFDDKVIVDEGRIYTTGAAYSFTSLMIYLLEKFCGRELALVVAKILMIQVHDTGQNAFAIFNLQHQHQDEAVRKVQEYMEKNFSKKITVKQLAEKFHFSERSLIRRFTQVTGNTPLDYIRRVRVEAAKRLLEKQRMSIDEAGRMIGYDDFNSFRIVFRKYTGLSPRDYKRKFDDMFRKISC